jgi:ATP-dependent DNA helicase RecQ
MSPIQSIRSRCNVRPRADNPVSVQTAADPVVQVLERYWGYREFRPWQREAIMAILDCRDSVLVLPTGGGKSLCFQAPALVEHGASGPRLALVVSPLIALMKDQVDGLVASGVPAACLNSAQAPGERSAAVSMVRSGACRLLYVSPERLVGDGSEQFREWIGGVGVRFIAIDEAHCISQWGHDFRPEYRLLGRLKHDFPAASIHAFTATATVRVRDDMAAQLGLRDPVVLVGPYDRPNLTYRVVPRMEMRQQVQKVLGRHAGEAGIIYCLSRREVDETAAWLQGLGVRALPYHAGMSDDARHANQEAFIDERADVVVATVAFGMGIDRPDVRFVVHAGSPRSLEHYQQESGRAGRDGLPAECVLIASPADFLRWKSLLETNNELSESNRQHLREMERYTAATHCRHRALVEYFGQSYPTGTACGACDWCLGELERIDEAVVVAQKILSCVARVGQRFGVAHVAAVLHGDATDAVLTRGHRELSTFGLLKECPVSEIRGYIDQLTQSGLLARTGEQYPTLQLTSDGVALLRGTGDCVLYRQPRALRTARGKAARRGAPTAATAALSDRERVLFEALRALRLELARERHVPPYVIFHDSTLQHLARLQPATHGELLGVPGVGQKKAESLGERVLATIGAHRAAAPRH